jgi:hypothetical protein
MDREVNRPDEPAWRTEPKPRDRCLFGCAGKHSGFIQSDVPRVHSDGIGNHSSGEERAIHDRHFPLRPL